MSDRKLAPSVPEAMPFLKERQEKQKENQDKQCKSLMLLAEGTAQNQFLFILNVL